MSSGVEVADEVIKLYDGMKIKTTKTVDNVRLATLMIKDGFISVAQRFTQSELEEKQQNVFDVLMSLMTPKTCMYILYDCHFSTEETAPKEELALVTWCPESALVKEKMIYASSRDALKRLTGLKHNLQINDQSDLERKAFAENLGKDVTHIEGLPV